MKTLCGWCGVSIADNGVPDGKVSHGICKACADKMDKELDKKEGNNGLLNKGQDTGNKGSVV